MAIKFFLRNAPDTVKDAIDLSREDFIEKYSVTTANRETLYKAWDEIRAIHLPKSQTKEVQFKVIQTDKKVVPITTPIEKKEVRFPETVEEVQKYEETGDLPELSHEQLQEELMLEAANEVEYTGSGKTADDPIVVKVKSNRGRKRLKDADKRDARILKLLKQGIKGQDILKKMKEEGYSVHAPQVTLIKQANKL
jgi:hypothetical protein